MRLTRRQLRRTVRRVLKESMHGHLDGNISNIVLAASHEVAQAHGDITVQEVLETLHSMSEQEILDHSDPARYDTLEYGEYLVSTIRQIDYDTVLDKMWDLVNMGELADGYEDFFSLPGV